MPFMAPTFPGLPVIEAAIDYSSDPRFASLSTDFPQVARKMLADIQQRKFNVKDIPKLMADSAADSNEVPSAFFFCRFAP